MSTLKKNIMYTIDQKIIAVCAESCQVSDIMSISRKRDTVIARQLAWKVMHDHLGYTFVKIGLIFGKNHATIISGLRVINNCLSVKDDIVTQRWNYVLSDANIQSLLFVADKRVCIIIPASVTSEMLLDHIRAKFPDCEIR